MKRFLTLVLGVIWLQWATLAAAEGDLRSLLQLIDYVGVDYPEAVEGGQVVNPAEYAEMAEFAERIAVGVAELEPGPTRDQLREKVRQLSEGVANKADPAEIAAITQTMRQQLMSNYPLVLTPRLAPDLKRAAALYQAQCAACHGVEGQGDGPAAAGMEPAPTDFHEVERARQRSVFGLYNTITLGVDGTAMTSFAPLSDADRWALAFYVGSLHGGEDLLAKGAAAWQQQTIDLHQAVTLSPAELATQSENGEALAVWLRTQPQLLFAAKPAPLDVAEAKLTESLNLVREGDVQAAQQAAITAYLEGFELAEAALSNVDKPLMQQIEKAMMGYRKAVADEIPLSELEQRHQALAALLEQARMALSGESLSAGVAFTSSLIILLREGLEAILVIAAMIAFLAKTGRRDALVYVHGGWIVALVAGMGTWAVSSYVITISGAARELTEGVTALFAACILFYVGFWMHRNANAQRWSQYLQGKMEAALSRQALWTLCVVSFLAVYREVFETVLFYQALWAQSATTEAHQAIWGGGIAAAVLLVAVTWAVARFGMRLPLKQFFSISAILMIVLAVIFAGKGVAALQEAGKLPQDPIQFPTIELLGIYPNLQGLLLQLVVLLAAIALLWRSRRSVD